MLKQVIKAIKDPSYRFTVLNEKGYFNRMPDIDFIKSKWKAFYGEELDLENPKTLCEKLQWLKLYYQKPEFTLMVDKYEAKRIVAKKMGSDSIIPTLGVWNHATEIDFNRLPSKFVLKPTHDSGGGVICHDKNKLNIPLTIRKLENSLSKRYYIRNREWPYKNVKPRIIAEPLIEQLGRPDSIEYKTTCFNGKVAFVTICTGIAHAKFEQRHNDHFDRDFNKMEWYVNYKPAQVTPQKPEQWEQLISFCESLAQGIPYLRVDSYIIDGQIKFGEMTFFTWGGFMHFQPKEWDLKLGQMLELPQEKSLIE